MFFSEFNDLNNEPENYLSIINFNIISFSANTNIFFSNFDSEKASDVIVLTKPLFNENSLKYLDKRKIHCLI